MSATETIKIGQNNHFFYSIGSKLGELADLALYVHDIVSIFQKAAIMYGTF